MVSVLLENIIMISTVLIIIIMVPLVIVLVIMASVIITVIAAIASALIANIIDLFISTTQFVVGKKKRDTYSLNEILSDSRQ